MDTARGRGRPKTNITVDLGSPIYYDWLADAALRQGTTIDTIVKHLVLEYLREHMPQQDYDAGESLGAARQQIQERWDAVQRGFNQKGMDYVWGIESRRILTLVRYRPIAQYTYQDCKVVGNELEALEKLLRLGS